MSRVKRYRRKSPLPKILAVVIIIAVLVGGGVFFGPKLVHHCSDCDKLFFGTGYYANVVSDTITSLTGDEQKILCQDCCATEHAVEIGLGHKVSEYKRPLFESKK